MSDSDTDSEMECPLCVEPLDMSDRNFLPCPCGYRVCMWCWHNIRENLNGLCPACRSPYNADPHAFSAVDQSDFLRKQKERRLREKQEKKTTTAAGALTVPGDKGGVQLRPSAQTADRRHLHNYRVIQRNLVYVIGVPAAASTEEMLRRPEYFGQYGKIGKIVVHGNRSITHSTVSVYITFAYKEDAKASIQVLDGFWLDGHHLRASFGTTKYCNNFIRGVPCNNPECVYLHDIGEDEDRFTKEEIQAGHSKLSPTPGSDQTIVIGNGGPSGTGKRPVGETVLPPPVFIQDIGPSSKPLSKPISWPLTGDSPSFEVVEGAYIPSPPTPEDSSYLEAEAIPHMPMLPASTVTLLSSESARRGPLTQPQPQTQTRTQSQAKYYAEGDIVAAAAIRESVLLAQQVQQQQQQRLASAMSESELVRSLQHKYGEGRSEALSRRSLAAAFNGLSNCAVFPVPVSSLAVSVWNDILNGSTPDLCTNPYGLLELPVSELLELTLPPVDAASAQAWPKPLHHYSRGMASNGLTSTPVGRHPYKPVSYKLAKEGKAAVAAQSGLDPAGGAGRPAGSSSPSSKIDAFQQVFPSVKVHRSVPSAIAGSM